jgi:hypothetical protein
MASSPNLASTTTVPVAAVARTVERDDGVFEIGRGRVVCDGFDFLFRIRHGLFKSRQPVLDFDFIERRGSPRGGPLLG